MVIYLHMKKSTSKNRIQYCTYYTLLDGYVTVLLTRSKKWESKQILICLVYLLYMKFLMFKGKSPDLIMKLCPTCM